MFLDADFKNVPSLFSEAKLDLSCLLSGLQKMKFTLPVQDLIPVDADVSKKIPQTSMQAGIMFSIMHKY